VPGATGRRAAIEKRVMRELEELERRNRAAEEEAK
jgi:rRNA-processing protein FCF1